MIAENWNDSELDDLAAWEEACEPTKNQRHRWDAEVARARTVEDSKPIFTFGDKPNTSNNIPREAKVQFQRLVLQNFEGAHWEQEESTGAEPEERWVKPGGVFLQPMSAEEKEQKWASSSLQEGEDQQQWLDEPLSGEREEKRRRRRGQEWNDSVQKIMDIPAEEDGGDLWIKLMNPTHHSFEEMQDADDEIRRAKDVINGEQGVREKWDLTEDQHADLLKKYNKGFELRHGVLGKVTRSGTWASWIPDEHRKAILFLCHDHRLAAHVGVTKMKARMSGKYWWQGMNDYIEKWVEVCQCARAKKTRETRRGRTKAFSFYSLYEAVHMDIVGPFPTSKSGNRYWLTLIDRFSRDTCLIPIKRQTADAVAEAFFKEWVCRRGPPRFLISDNGSAFVSEVIAELCALCGVKQIFSAPYHPEANGLAERVHRFALASLQALTKKDARSWDDKLPAIAFGIITSRLAGHRVSPFEVIHGVRARLPADLLTGQEKIQPRTVDAYYEAMTKVWDTVRKEFEHDNVVAAEKMRLSRDREMNRFIATLKVGTWVYWTRPYSHQESEQGWKKVKGKWSMKPGQIKAVKGRNSFVVEVGDGKVKVFRAADLAVDSTGGKPQFRTNPIRDRNPHVTSAMDQERASARLDDQREVAGEMRNLAKEVMQQPGLTDATGSRNAVLTRAADRANSGIEEPERPAPPMSYSSSEELSATMPEEEDDGVVVVKTVRFRTGEAEPDNPEKKAKKTLSPPAKIWVKTAVPQAVISRETGPERKSLKRKLQPIVCRPVEQQAFNGGPGSMKKSDPRVAFSADAE